MPRLVQWIWLLLAVHFAVGAIAYTHFLATGEYALLTLYFNVEGTPFFLLMTALECALALSCCVWLHHGDPMRKVWMLMAFAALARVAGSLMHSIAALHLPWKAMAWSSVHPLGPFEDLAQLGTIVGSPVSMCCMAAALVLLLIDLRRRRISVRLTRIDIALVMLILSFTVSQIIVIAPLFKTHPNLGVMLLWTSDPLLLALLVEAVIVRRAMIRMGDGLFSRCMGMYVLGIAITSGGDAAIWADQHGLLTPALTALSWYIWFAATAAFTSAPAYQIALLQQTAQDRDPAARDFGTRTAASQPMR